MKQSAEMIRLQPEASERSFCFRAWNGQEWGKAVACCVREGAIPTAQSQHYQKVWQPWWRCRADNCNIRNFRVSAQPAEQWPRQISKYLISLGLFPYLKMEVIKEYVLVSQGCYNKHYKVGDFKQKTFILSQFCRLEVQNQGFSRAMLPVKAPGKNLSLPLPASGSCQ